VKARVERSLEVLLGQPREASAIDADDRPRAGSTLSA
jgi:hypothetical protein